MNIAENVHIETKYLLYLKAYHSTKRIRSRSEWFQFHAFKFYWRFNKLATSRYSQWLVGLMSVFLRLLCMSVLVYVLLIMIHETDSWTPLVNLIFCAGIGIDLFYFIRRRREHAGYI